MKQNIKNTWEYLKFTLGLIWQSKNGKKIILMKIITIIFNAISPIVFVLIPGMIINELLEQQRIPTLALYVGILAIVPVLNALISLTIKMIFTRHIDAFKLSSESRFYSHLLRMDYETYEKPDIQGLASRALFAFGELHDVLDAISSFASAVLSIVAISVVIATLNLAIILLIVCIIIANSLVTSSVNKKVFAKRRDEDKLQIKNNRYRSHYNNPQFAKEARLYNISDFVKNLFVSNRIEWDKFKFKRSITNDLPGVFRTITGMLQSGIIYAYLIHSVISNGMAVGYVAIFLAATGQFSSIFGNIAQTLLGFQKKSFAIRDAQEFLAMPLRQYDSGDLAPIFDKNSEIRFENVSFKYPGSENYALKNINIAFRGDEKICVVGHNGSGKSTFVKLLSRLYMPTEGTIYLNGKNIMEYKYTEYQRLFAAVFQEPSLFAVSLGQNISLNYDFDKARMDEVCKKCGLTELVKKLPKGYDTMTEKSFDYEGIVPSGGETQRIMMARAIYHGAPMYILDEPTAAMDPLIEYEIYTQFSDMINDSAAVLITHRLSAVKLVDKVAVFERGKLVEYGTHDELFAKNGAYHEMYEKQAHFYIK